MPQEPQPPDSLADWQARLAAHPRLTHVLRYVVVFLAVALTSELVRHLPLERPWTGTITMGVVLVCCWWGGVGPSLCIPPLLLVIARWHQTFPTNSPWLSRREWVAMAMISLITVSVGLAGEYRRRIAAVKREHSQKLRDQARALSQARIIFRDISGRVTEWSDGAAALFGWSSAEAVGSVLSRLLDSVYPQPPARINEELLATGQWQGEVLHQHRDGRTLHVATHWILYRDSRGAPIGVAEVYNDVTELRRAEAAIREADRRKEEFLATLAHELRNPLAPIQNSLELLRLSGGGDEQQQSVREIMQQQVSHLVHLVDDLLDVSRVTHGKIALQRERVLLRPLVNSALEIVRSQIDGREQQLTVVLPEQPVQLHVDAVRMTQVIANLLGNASKYTDPRGAIHLVASVAGDELTLTIRDTGVGIPPDMLDRIFEMFSQVDRSLTRSSGGLGIGLSLVKRLVELHGGTIAAHSAGLEQGSEFCVRLPVVEPLSEAAVPVPETREAELSRRRILVVDDTRAASFVLAKLLEKLGQDVRVAGDGEEGVELALAWRPDVVFSDIAMPRMDGYELARRIREQDDLAGVYLVAVTGYGQEDDRARALEAGFNDHMTKPAGLAEIRRLLATLPEPVTVTR